MPPMPPPGIAGAAASFFGLLAIMASVVISSEATEAASCRAHADDLGRVHDAGGDHVTILFGLGVVAEVAGLFQHLADHDGAFATSVDRDLADRGFESARHDLQAGSCRRCRRTGPRRPSWHAAEPRRRRARCLLQPQRGLRSGRHRRGPCAPSLRFRWHRRP
jgi:hypothetical protein